MYCAKCCIIYKDCMTALMLWRHMSAGWPGRWDLIQRSGRSQCWGWCRRKRCCGFCWLRSPGPNCRGGSSGWDFLHPSLSQEQSVKTFFPVAHSDIDGILYVGLDDPSEALHGDQGKECGQHLTVTFFYCIRAVTVYQSTPTTCYSSTIVFHICSLG